MPKNDYISRRELYDKINDIGGCDATEEWAKGYDSAIDAVMGIIEGVPAADVEPVRHGHWVKEKKDVLIHWHCSACKECYFLEEPNAKYCPNCGAKMDGDKNDT